LLDYLLSLTADILNLRHWQTNIPAEFETFYDQQKYATSQEYLKVNTQFGLLVATIDLLLLLIFWFAGGFSWLNDRVTALNLSLIPSGLIYIGALLLVKSILSLPFDLYSTFVIEERYGFNNSTVKTFFTDRLKALMLGVLVGAPLLALILLLFSRMGQWAWIFGWISVTLFSIILQVVAPIWILPLFNKFQPLEEGELKERIISYSSRVKYPLAGLYVMDGSKRSTKSNAFFTGMGKNKRIALFDTLMTQHTVDEIVAILAHEIGHYKKKHILINLGITILHSGFLLFLMSLFLSNPMLYQAFYMNSTPIYAGLLFFGMLYSPIEMILSLGIHAMMRKNEYQADHFAAVTTGSPDPLITALKKLTVNNMMNLTPHPAFVFINYTHPPVLQRITALRNITSIE